MPLSINSVNDDWSPRLMPDELTLFFSSSRVPHGEGGAGLFVATRDASTIDFASPLLMPNVNSTAVTVHPTVTADGINLYFQSSATGKNDIYFSTRANTGVSFGTPQVVNVSDPALEDDAPFIRADGTVLYFTRYDSSGLGGPHHIMRTVEGATAVTFGPPAPEDEINSTKFDTTFPAVTPDDLTIFFASNDSKGTGDYDIYKAERARVTDPFVNVTQVAEINTTGGDYPSWISANGCTLYLMSTGRGGPSAPGNLDMFVATRNR